MTPEAITTAYEKFIEAEERRSLQGQRDYVYASTWSACTRQMALDMLRPDVKAPFQADTLANFRRGKDRERDLIADLTRVGRHCDPPFELVGAQERFTLRDKKGRVAIVGKVDTRIKFLHQVGSDPVEIKSWHPNLVQGVKKFADLFGNRWTRKGAFQLLAYLLATNEPRGWLFLDRPGIPRPLKVDLYEHLDKIEDFLTRAEVAMDARERVTAFIKSPHVGPDEAAWQVKALDTYLPPFIDDPSECRVCPFMGSACNPPLTYQGATIITEDEVLALLESHEALEEPRTEYKGIHEELAEYLKRRTPKTFKNGLKQQIIAGKYLIETTWQKKSETDERFLTEETLAAIAAAKKTNDAGRFSFEVTKVTE